MTKSLKKFLFVFGSLLVLVAVSLGVYAWHGSFIGQETSPNGAYALRYYKSFNPFKMYWSMPGDSACRPVWVRLYSKKGDKLQQLYTDDCNLEMQVRWHGKQVFLPDGETVWDLPVSSGSE